MERELHLRKFENGESLKYPAFHAEAFCTERGTSYLKEPGVVMIAQSVPNLEGMRTFLKGFDDELGFSQYLDDPVKLDPSAQIVKLAGQNCYMSYGPKRSMNKDATGYIENIVSSGHGSVMEHPNFTLLFYGVDRSFTHELVRHRAGMGYSQESQRYVGGKVLRFVERPEFQDVPELHKQFEQRIDRVADEYKDLTTRLLTLQGEGLKIVSAEQATDKRKKVRQAARAALTNETEAIIVVTGNLRAWRHIFNMRVSEHSEVQIRKAIHKAYKCLKEVEPTGFGDFEEVQLNDGTVGLRTNYPKV
ncbi:MAG: Thymidylate synthase, flavin-dependent [Microgenomates group bacterium GW2011_GWC1_43_13]|uniref:FAD-dependent thymidylate synthase n=3 Tax=Candidatus Woeseibacteriota TaxID=1752722 RepID=A0A837IK21_9BACT|nr:MAG: Thymidylate synthase, flavin-dependent [Microgenomates group bacterium GW2011_GWC1_43_13]KKT33226.1 MAG: Thymidylate synthase, flavin-dependent [Candidatus Woesebacteria bacterium GW2011_GWB1_44_11]KKT54372.1 MAG: Thymidylate synthase, flavin-dependent [Candidatus Woesebacteria bacterium GW2011_GWA1_44_23]OGM75838.1 MAG: thymidylate synthase, flavin-dependent [Candidatus Woesebacteria bacterium RIFOXYA1_FULL_43_16]OGM83338.1 MAG: thymidylate synthase, flavin-dependent [Candidatus Woeseb